MHVAGSIHADATSPAPVWLTRPEDVNSLTAKLWSETVTRGEDGVISVGGIRLTDLAEQVGTPAYVIDEVDFRSRAHDWREAFAGWTVYYAGKSFLCGTDRPLGGRGGPQPRRLLARGAHRGAARRLRPGADRHARQQQVRGRTPPRARARRRADHRRLLRRDHPAGEPLRRARHHGTGDDPGHHRRRGAHPRVHRHRPRGPEVRLLDRRRPGAGRTVPLPPQPAAEPAGRPLPHRIADLRHQRLRGGRPTHAQAVQRSSRRPPASNWQSSTSAAASASPTPRRTPRPRRPSWPPACARSSSTSAAASA